TIFEDLERRVTLTRAFKALPMLKVGIEQELISFLEKLQNYETLEEAILSATPTQIAFLAKHYRTLKNTGIIKVEDN
ncbi:MAG: hypothetical protein QXX18_10015, partial [Candidatus Jordarchaeales archaeon]